MHAVSGPITQNTTNLITVLLLPVAILMIAYALTTFYARSVYLQRKQVPLRSPPVHAVVDHTLRILPHKRPG